MTLHKDITAANIHIPYAFSYADATARGAATGFSAQDVGKLARQLDDNSLWLLSDDSPATWVQVSGVGAGGGYTPGGTDVAVADGGTGASTASAARTNLGLAIGTDVAAHPPINDARYYTETEVDALIAGAGGYTSENARDDIGAALVAGTGVTITPNDGADTITIAATGGSAEPTERTKRVIQVTKRPNATSVFFDGVAEPDQTGTITSADDVDGPWLSHATSTTTGNGCGLLPSFAGYTQARRGWNPELIVRIRTDPTTYASTRLMIGLASAGGYDGSATPAISHALFRYDTSADGTAFWRCISDSGSGTPEATTTSVAVAADTVYRFEIRMSSSNVTFYINGTLVATHSTTIPAANTPLGFVVRVVNLASTARVIKWSRVALLHD